MVFIINDQTTSNFHVKCKDKTFFVHQSVLSAKSQYFAALLANMSLGNGQKELIIDDFEPEIVERLST